MRNISKKQLGNTSLLIAVIGLIVTKLLIHYGYLNNNFWNIVSTGFEAATVGGIADWFAVTALFRQIPIPVLRRHTDIIVKNRQKLTEGVVELVTTKWLAPEVIKEKISEISFSANLLQMLYEPRNRTRAIGLIKDILSRLSDNLDSPLLATFLQETLKEKMSGMDMAAPLGRWLKARILNGDHHQLWDMLLESAYKTINEPEMRKNVTDLIKKQIENYKDKDFLKKIFVSIAEFTDVIDTRIVAEKVINAMNQFIRDAEDNPHHPARERFDGNLLAFAQELIDGDPKACQWVHEMQEQFIHNSEAEKIILKMLSRFKTGIREQLQDNGSLLQEIIETNFNNYLEKLDANKEMQGRIDEWMKNAIFELIVKYYPEIGNMIRTSLSILSNNELVLQIEEKVGDDLQYIRLNGAIVGGLAGMLIAMIDLIFTGSV